MPKVSLGFLGTFQMFLRIKDLLTRINFFVGRLQIKSISHFTFCPASQYLGIADDALVELQHFRETNNVQFCQTLAAALSQI